MTLDTLTDNGVSSRSGGQTSNTRDEPAGSNQQPFDDRDDQSFSAHLERQTGRKPGKTALDDKRPAGTSSKDTDFKNSGITGETSARNSGLVSAEDVAIEISVDSLVTDSVTEHDDRKNSAGLPVRAGEKLPELDTPVQGASRFSESEYAGGVDGMTSLSQSMSQTLPLDSVTHPTEAGPAQTVAISAALTQLALNPVADNISVAKSTTFPGGIGVPVISNAANQVAVNSDVVEPATGKLSADQLAKVSLSTALAVSQDSIVRQHLQQQNLGGERVSSEGGGVAEEFSSDMVTANSRERIDVLSPSGQALKARFSAHANADWSGLIRDQVMFVRSGALTFARIEMDPVELGPLDLQMQVRGNEVSVSILAQPHTRELLDAHAQRIRDALTAQGFEQVELQIDNASSQARDSGTSSGNEQTQRGFDRSGEAEESTEIAQVRLRSERLLDAFV